VSDLKQITTMAHLMERQENKVTDLEEQLKAAKEDLRRTAEEDLPQAMIEAGVSELRLDNGRPLKLEEDAKTSITGKTRTAALRWLMDNGYAGLIKTEVVARFNRGAHDEALELSRRIAGEHEEVELKETVHAGTLKAFVKEQMREGNPIPMDLFNVHPYQKATLGKVK